MSTPTRRTAPTCCACAASGHATADPAIPVMKSRRRIAFPKAGTTPIRTRLQQGFATDEMGFRGYFARQQLKAVMSALGQKQTLGKAQLMSALPPKADIRRRECDLRQVPLSEVTAPISHAASSSSSAFAS